MDVLFNSVSIFDVLQDREAKLEAEVGGLDRKTIESTPMEQLVHSLTAKHKLAIPVLQEDKVEQTSEEVEVDVSHDPRRWIFENGPSYVKGIEITIHLPFIGDAEMFYIQPQTHNVNGILGEIEDNEILLRFRRTDTNGLAVRADYERSKDQIKQHLAWLGESILAFNAALGNKVQTFLGQQKHQLSAVAEMIQSTGIPARKSSARMAAAEISTKVMTKGTDSPQKWDVFISHATEDKSAVARPLAEGLRARGVEVWYDEFSLKMGDSLRASIDFGLGNSRYGVVILSKKFFAKHWPQQELNGLASQETATRNTILPVWHEVSAEDVRGFSPILADRKGVPSTLGIPALVDEIIKVLEGT